MVIGGVEIAFGSSAISRASPSHLQGFYSTFCRAPRPEILIQQLWAGLEDAFLSIYLLVCLLYFIDYAITIVLIFLPLPPSTEHPLLSQAIPPPRFMSMGHACKFFGYSISYTVPYIPMAVL